MRFFLIFLVVNLQFASLHVLSEVRMSFGNENGNENSDFSYKESERLRIVCTLYCDNNSSFMHNKQPKYDLDIHGPDIIESTVTIEKNTSSCPFTTSYTLSQATLNNSGDYKCHWYYNNCVSNCPRWELHKTKNYTVKIQPKANFFLSLFLITSSAFIFLWMAILIFVCIFYKRKGKENSITLEAQLTDCTDLLDNVDKLEYSPLFEISKANLNIVGWLGEGCYGNVYSGKLDLGKQWKQKNRIYRGESKLQVAIKIPCTTKTSEHQVISRKMLMDELKIMCAVGRHPNIVNLIGAVTINELLVVVEICENNSLKHYLNSNAFHFHPQYQREWTQTEYERFGYLREGNIVLSPAVQLTAGYLEPLDKEKWEKLLKTGLTTSHLLSFGMQIAQGMNFLVSKKCIHRDLAARNILVTVKGLCKITDFGLAKCLEEKDYYRCKTDKYLPLKWMAPEAHQQSSVQSDIWSFGIVLYELFSLGGEPYPDVSINDINTHLANGKRCERPEYCHDALYEFMNQCWNFDPAIRPSFNEAADLLELHLCISSKKLLDDIRKEITSEGNKQLRYAKQRQTAYETAITFHKDLNHSNYLGYKKIATTERAC